MWDRYAACCRAAAAASSPGTASPNSVLPPETVTEQAVEAVERQIRTELKISKPDPLLPKLVHLFEKGDLVMIDKGSRIPPLDLPIKAEWFGIPSFREVGVVSREVRYKISVLDERTNKALDARRKGTSALREKFSFPLADGSRWMPHKAKPLFQAELKRLEEEGRKLLGSIVSGTPEEWVESKRDLVTRDANRQYEEFHPGKRMPEQTIAEIMTALTERFRKATSANFLPKVSFVKTGFRLAGDSEHVSDWAAARTLLRAVAEYPRTAMKNRAYFFRGLPVSEEDVLTAMNVVEDPLVREWFHAKSLHTATEELEVLDHIDESERSDRDKCELILCQLHRGRPLDEIRNAAIEKAESRSNNAPTNPFEPNSPTRSVYSPEETRHALSQVRDMMLKGHLQLAPGNEVLPLPDPGLSQRGVINPNISRESEVAEWEWHHQTAMEAITEEDAKQSLKPKSKLSPEAISALGNVSPELAWLQLVDMVFHAQAEYSQAAQEVVSHMGLQESLDHLLESLATKSAFPDTVSAINHLVESNPTMDLRDIDHLPLLEPLKAIARMLTTNEAYL